MVATSWKLVLWAVGILAVLMAAGFLLRDKIISPLVREQQRLKWDWDKRGKRSNWWMDTAPALWVPLTILVPPEPRWIGVVAGVLAGLHVYFAVVRTGTSDDQ